MHERVGNRAVDATAKLWAKLHPEDCAVLEEVQQTTGVVREVARWLGYVGQKLMDRGNPDVQAQDVTVVRSSGESMLQLVGVPLPEVTASWSWAPRLTLAEERNFVPGLIVAEEPAEAVRLHDRSQNLGPAEGVLIPCEGDGGRRAEDEAKHLEPSTVECQASSPQPSAAAGHCEAGVGVHGSHDLRRAGDLTFCNKCSRYTARLTSTGQPVSTKLLASKCAGPLEKPTGQLYRMRSGKNPTTKRFMGPVRRI